MAGTGKAGSYHFLTILGAALTTISAALFLVFLVIDLVGFYANPYLGIVTFVVLPALFVLGLLLIPMGAWRRRRRVARTGREPAWPILDFGRRPVRLGAIAVLVLTTINVAIVALAAYKSVEYADSTEFCTGVCHTPMRPQAVAHRASVHASISCASCHVGPGPEGFAQAKLSGVRRLAAMADASYERPVPVPVHDLPAAGATCGSCHTPTRYIGDRVRQFRYYSDDETTSEQVTTLTLSVGGGGWEDGGPRGIHWHASPGTRIEYIAADETRETIPWVRVVSGRGEVREYVAEGVSAEQIAAAERRVMDCTDCHNRPGHAIAASADRAVDGALGHGLLPRLPFIRREAIAALSDASRPTAEAERAIAERLTAFYGPQIGGGPQVAQAIAATQRLYATNVFPEMGVRWGTYPNQLGHTDSPGCFRCHDEAKRTASGLVLSQDCESCHRMQ